MEIKTANDLYNMCRIVLAHNGAHGRDSVYMPRIVCEDGFAFSSQAGRVFYSEPREDWKVEYSAFELGWLSGYEPLLADYAEHDADICEEMGEPIDWTKEIYPYVPAQVVQLVIEKHGGIDDLETLNAT